MRWMRSRLSSLFFFFISILCFSACSCACRPTNCQIARVCVLWFIHAEQSLDNWSSTRRHVRVSVCAASICISHQLKASELQMWYRYLYSRTGRLSFAHVRQSFSIILFIWKKQKFFLSSVPHVPSEPYDAQPQCELLSENPEIHDALNKNKLFKMQCIRILTVYGLWGHMWHGPRVPNPLEYV